MTSLTAVYRHRVGAVADRRRILVGGGLFGLGVTLTAAGVVLATAGVGSWFDLGTYGARELAGILAGFGLPATFVGIFTVLPSSRVTRAAAAIGASLCVFGVALFTHAYPTQWPGAPAADPLLTLTTLSVYFVGAVTTGWCLFVAVATFKTRKSPGGTAEMRITQEGQIELVRETDGAATATGGVGLFGTDPDGEVPTQTGPVGPADREHEDSNRAASDGGSATAGPADTEDTVVESAATRGQPDRYCGNCEHFHYVRVDEEIQPFCAHDDRYMDDIEPCSAWSANSHDDRR
ncbi:hypothetical protein [Halorhabdus sp. CUG00001]|uniref:DUF7139 domain-containing protein n=1 Tax=Halorhabdus sp. CUG00001 TaxID=2600297 RepID=UPI00131CD860|nr:hypothetical protein [Halorhabdus sp. CUG00001]